MNLSHLKYFFDAVRAESFNEAARKNLVSQSAVSQAIRALEKEFGAPLLRHAKRRFDLTDEGRWLFEQSAALLQENDRVHREFSTASREPRGELVFAAPQSLLIDSLLEPLSQLRRDYPGLRVKTLTGSAQVVKNHVSRRDCQLGFALDDQRLDGFSTETLAHGEFVAVMKRGSKLDLAKQGLVVTNGEKAEVRHVQREWQRQHKAELPIDFEIMSWSVIKALALSGHGIGFVPRYVVSREVAQKKLVEVVLPGKAYRYAIKALWPVNQSLPRNARLLLDAVKKHVKGS